MDVFNEADSEFLESPDHFNPLPHVIRVLEQGLENDESLTKWQEIFQDSLLRTEQLIQQGIQKYAPQLEQGVKLYDQVKKSVEEIEGEVKRMRKEVQWCENKVAVDEQAGGPGVVSELVSEKRELGKLLGLICDIERVSEGPQKLRRTLNENQVDDCLELLQELEQLASATELVRLSCLKGPKEQLNLFGMELENVLVRRVVALMSSSTAPLVAIDNAAVTASPSLAVDAGQPMLPSLAALLKLGKIERAVSAVMEGIRQNVDEITNRFHRTLSQVAESWSLESQTIRDNLYRFLVDQLASSGTPLSVKELDQLNTVYKQSYGLETEETVSNVDAVLFESYQRLVKDFYRMLLRYKDFQTLLEAELGVHDLFDVSFVTKLVAVELRQLLDQKLTYRTTDLRPTKTSESTSASEAKSHTLPSVLRNNTVYKLFTDMPSSAATRAVSQKDSSLKLVSQSSPLLFPYVYRLTVDFIEETQASLGVSMDQLQEYCQRFCREVYCKQLDKHLLANIAYDQETTEALILSLYDYTSMAGVIPFALGKEGKGSLGLLATIFPSAPSFEQPSSNTVYVSKLWQQHLQQIGCIRYARALLKDPEIGMSEAYILSSFLDRMREILQSTHLKLQQKLSYRHFSQKSVTKVFNSEQQFQQAMATSGNCIRVEPSTEDSFLKRERVNEHGLARSLLSASAEDPSLTSSAFGDLFFNDTQISRLAAISTLAYFVYVRLGQPSAVCEGGSFQQSVREKAAELLFEAVFLLRSELRLLCAFKLTKAASYLRSSMLSGTISKEAGRLYSKGEVADSLRNMLTLVSMYANQRWFPCIFAGINALLADIIIRSLYHIVGAVREAKFLKHSQDQRAAAQDDSFATGGDVEDLCQSLIEVVDSVKTVCLKQDMDDVCGLSALEAAMKYFQLVVNTRTTTDLNWFHSQELVTGLEEISSAVHGILLTEDLKRLLQASI